ncbi:hypothetical protein WR25_21472 [Diploscapter pachys]|uniref:Ubiquitin-like domain-containing protein n=1 Tax=Diploscapter pachys TaxID=2018661 RepID=A0A2A2JFD3_9BILA|nr:hypothetical protein WR25_21472 [Diploscapter pachys]
MRVRVKLELEVELEEDDRIRDVKWRIDKMIGIPVENLIIDKLLSIPPFGDNPPSYRDHRIYDHMRLGDLAVREWSNRNLVLDIKHHIPKELTISVVTPAHVTLRVRALDSWTISRLKSAISDIAGTQHSQRLIAFNGKPLLLYHRLMEAGVSENSTLELIEPDVGPMTITFKTFVGIEPIRLDVRAESTIEEIKRMLYETRMLPFSALKLIYFGYGSMIFLD